MGRGSFYHNRIQNLKDNNFIPTIGKWILPPYQQLLALIIASESHEKVNEKDETKEKVPVLKALMQITFSSPPGSTGSSIFFDIK